jgi:hypothetical protein
VDLLKETPLALIRQVVDALRGDDSIDLGRHLGWPVGLQHVELNVAIATTIGRHRLQPGLDHMG